MAPSGDFLAYRQAMPVAMPTPFMTTADLHLRDLGSVYDPVLHGVSGGLAELFPPIHDLQRPETETEGKAAGERDELAAHN